MSTSLGAPDRGCQSTYPAIAQGVMMLIGVHAGVSAGYPEALQYAADVGAECAQVFAKSPRQWHSRALSRGVVEAFRARRLELGIGPVFTHTAYLINLGTTDEMLRARSVEALADELGRAAMLGADGVITHVGTRGGTPLTQSAARVASAITEAYQRAPGQGCRLLLENTAGAGTTFGSTPDELGAIMAELGGDTRERVAVCLDTCHAHAAGFDLSSAEGWERILDGMDDACGSAAIVAVHANDCVSECGSKRDRHAWIGDGTIGYKGFSAMLCEPRLRGLPAICEMPGPVPQKDVENVRRLKLLRAEYEARA